MIRFGLVSDFHANHRGDSEFRKLVAKIDADTKDLDFVIDCGDSEWGYRITRPVYRINGNHDFYGGTSQEAATDEIVKFTREGLVFAGICMWTNMAIHEFTARSYRDYMADYRYIRGMGPTNVHNIHLRQLELLGECEADVVFTHHAPSLASCHSRFRSENPAVEAVNYSFALPSIEHATAGWKKRPFLWMHGHVHDTVDYVESGVRVIANPLGYPHEKNISGYSPKIITINEAREVSIS